MNLIQQSILAGAMAAIVGWGICAALGQRARATRVGAAFGAIVTLVVMSFG